MTYEEHMQAIATAAQAMYAAQERVDALRPTTPPPFSDEYVDARVALADAREAYDAAYAAKVGAGVPVRRA